MLLPAIPWALLSTWAGRAGTRLFRWRRRPILRISFDPQDTYHVRAVLDHVGQLGRFCHFTVNNDGSDTALTCRARLMSVETLTEYGQPLPASGFVAPRVLKWAHELDFGPRDVERDVPRRADLCYAVDGETYFWLFVAVGAGVQTIFPAGRYRVRVRVDADNAAHVEASFVVTYDGTWSSITVMPVA